MMKHQINIIPTPKSCNLLKGDIFSVSKIYQDGFGLNLDRFPEYADIMRYANDEARKHGMNLYTGCYGMPRLQV